MPLCDPRRSAFVGVALLVLVFAAFSPVFQNDFINYDDNKYVTDNPQLRESFPQTLRWAFTTFTASNWHPITWLSHRLDVALFGLNPRGHHATSLVFHAANTLLLFCLLQQMTGTVWTSALAAAFFGIHPLHVESVVWAAERKDLLSTLFLFLTLAAYRRYVGRKEISWYAAMILLFALGLMSKPMLVTVPVLLLCLDHWPLDRFRFGERIQRQARSSEPLSSLLAEKLPLVVLSLLSAAITWTAQSQGGAVKTFEEYPLAIRVGNAFVSAVQYAAKMVWPQGLAIVYPHPGLHLSAVNALLSAGLLAAVTFWAADNMRRFPYFMVGWLWYLVSLLPVLGLVQVGGQAMADRYTYIPLIGLFVIVGWCLGDLGRTWADRRVIIWTAAAAALLSLAVVTRLQVRTWRSSVAVFEHALKVTENNFVAHDNLASALLEDGRTRDAMRHALAALRLYPDKEPSRYLRFGSALLQEGMNEEAVEVLEKATQMRPYDQTARRLLDLALAASARGRSTSPGPGQHH